MIEINLTLSIDDENDIKSLVDIISDSIYSEIINDYRVLRFYDDNGFLSHIQLILKLNLSLLFRNFIDEYITNYANDPNSIIMTYDIGIVHPQERDTIGVQSFVEYVISRSDSIYSDNSSTLTLSDDE